ncbi:MAG: hypothetical protein ACTSWY_03300 [Promethearchaeota archaeon]
MDVFLYLHLDEQSGNPRLKIQKISLDTNEVELEDSIDCIHTVITDISPEEFNRYQENSLSTRSESLKKWLNAIEERLCSIWRKRKKAN